MSERNVKAVDRAIDLLDLLAVNYRGIPLADIAQALELPKSTAHRLLNALVERNLVRQSPHTGNYMLGYGILTLSRAFMLGFDLSAVAHPILVRLNKEFDETVHLGVLDEMGEKVVFIDKIDSSQVVRMVSAIGERLPIHCTSLGKALLACLDDQTLRRRLATYEFHRFTPNTIVALEPFMKELAVARERGYTTDFQENDAHVTCVGAPICNQFGEPLAAISLSAPAARLSPERIEIVGSAVAEVGREISRLLSDMPSEERTKLV
jgi:DNA-binding IclR family transcriptional regulator